MDLWEKYDITSINGNQYYLLMVDDATRYTTVKFLKMKSQATTQIKNYLTYLASHNKHPQALHVNRSTEFLNQELHNWCMLWGIQIQTTVPYSLSQNGITERMNRTLTKLVCTMLTDSNSPQFLWELAIAHAAYIRNLSYTKLVKQSIPYEAWNKRKPDITHL
jgi:transposase InsO family protein